MLSVRGEMCEINRGETCKGPNMSLNLRGAKCVLKGLKGKF